MLPSMISDGPGPSSIDRLARWMSTGLACIAGRREFAKGRYVIADLAEDGLLSAVARFQDDVRQLRKVALICLMPRTAANTDPNTPALAVLRELSAAAAAVSGRPAEELLNGGVLELPVLLDCPVTGAPTTYSFFGVAFCPQAANAADTLYDLPLSAPFALVNITSDAFAFAMFVRDMSLARHGVAPHQLAAHEDRASLFADCVARWQAFSMHTLSTFAARTAGTRCPVRVSEDGRSWQAVHSDPVFAETVKEPHTHEMPCVYAAELALQWTAVLDRQAPQFHARSGQTGGRPLGGHCPVAGLARLFRRTAAAQ